MSGLLSAGAVGRLAEPTSGAVFEATQALVANASGKSVAQLANEATVSVVEVTLSSAQILALNATPITVLDAPGAGLVNVIKSVYATKAAGTAYAGVATGEDIALKYTNSTGAVCATLEMTGFADSASATQSYAAGASTLPVANAAIVAHMLTGEITTGNSPFLLRIEYQTLAVPAF